MYISTYIFNKREKKVFGFVSSINALNKALVDVFWTHPSSVESLQRAVSLSRLDNELVVMKEKDIIELAISSLKEEGIKIGARDIDFLGYMITKDGSFFAIRLDYKAPKSGVDLSKYGFIIIDSNSGQEVS